MWWLDLIPAAVNMFNGAIGTEQGDSGYDKSLSIEEDSYNRVLEMLASGKLGYDPQTASFVPQGPSAMAGVQADQGAVNAQRQALGRLDQASKEGYSSVDKAALNAIMNEANQNEKSQRDAQLSRLDPNSGASIAARMGAQQSSANRANQDALDQAAMSRKQALAALSGYGNLAGQMRQQSFGEGSARAQAEDAIAKFNAANSYDASRFNAGQWNDAQQRRIGNTLGAAHEISGAAGKYADRQASEAERKQRNADIQSAQTANMIGAVGKGISENTGDKGGDAGGSGETDAEAWERMEKERLGE